MVCSFLCTESFPNPNPCSSCSPGKYDGMSNQREFNTNACAMSHTRSAVESTRHSFWDMYGNAPPRCISEVVESVFSSRVHSLPLPVVVSSFSTFFLSRNVHAIDRRGVTNFGPVDLSSNPIKCRIFTTPSVAGSSPWNFFKSSPLK